MMHLKNMFVKLSSKGKSVKSLTNQQVATTLYQSLHFCKTCASKCLLLTYFPLYDILIIAFLSSHNDSYNLVFCVNGLYIWVKVNIVFFWMKTLRLNALPVTWLLTIKTDLTIDYYLYRKTVQTGCQMIASWNKSLHIKLGRQPVLYC